MERLVLIVVLYKNSEECLLIRSSKLVIRDKKLPSNLTLAFPRLSYNHSFRKVFVVKLVWKMLHFFLEICNGFWLVKGSEEFCGKKC